MSMMGELKFFLGIQIHQFPRGIFINQAKYAQEILVKHGMTSCDGIGTPMATKHLDADLIRTPVDQTKYHSKVEALMYLTASRPDIMHATCYCARYQAQPTKKHLTAVKRIFRYLKDTIHMGLWYLKDTGFELTAFSISDHAGCLDSRKSTSEAEYVSLSACCAQVLWMRTQLTDYGFHFDKIPMYCDSKAAIAISCNPVHHSHTKHIDVRYHFIKEKVKKGIVELFFVRTEYQLADLFTKALPVESFQYLVKRLDTRSHDGKDDQDIQGKDLKISEPKTKSKDNDKSSRSKITQHEGTSLQQDKDLDKDSISHPKEFKDHTLGEIVGLKYVCVHGSSESQDTSIRKPRFREDC
nr:retrovirus-related Pol polyprotein from transposon TNT 1-94 [Tanacetum cinerariifolium]